jgi:hypothetical protein
MAIGSSLALLFKVGVDAKDAEAAFQHLMATNKEFAKGVEEGARAEIAAFNKVNESSKQLGITFNQVRVAIGQLVGGLTLVRAFREIAQSIEEIGTRSKEDFDTLQKQVESAGGHITELQRNIAQELLGAFDKVKGASAGFMAEVIETSGPALITLLKDIAKWLGDLKPIAKAIGDDIADTFNRINAMGRAIIELRQRQAAQQPGIGESIAEALVPGLAFKRAMDDMNTFDEAYARHLKNVTEETKKFVAKNAGDDGGGGGSIKKVRKDITEAALEQAQAENALTLVRQDAAIADKQINEDQAKGLITQEEGARRRIAVLAELQKAETAVLDARKKAVETDPTLLANQRAKQLNDIETQRAVLRTQAAEAQREEDNKTIAADQKLHDAFAAHFVKLKQEWLTYADFVHQQTDAIVQDLARQAQAIPGGGTGVPGLPDPAAVQGQLNSIHQSISTFFSDNAKSWADNAKLVRDAVTGQIDLMATLHDEVERLKDQFVSGLAKGIGAVVEQYVILGQTGPAVIKRILAETLASIASQAAVQAIFATAYGFLMLAFQQYAEAAAAFEAAAVFAGVAVAAGLAGRAIAPAAAGAGGGASGFGGSTAAPGTVTINQGAGSGLGIQLQILNALNNITTAPPGDVLQRGAEQNPMVIGQANNEAARRDGTVSREFLQISGLRTA